MNDYTHIIDILTHNGYEYVSFLGEGSFSTVFLCKSIQYNHLFAVKRTFKHKLTQFEFNTLMSLNHPNIIKLYDAFNDDVSQFLVMEYCEKGTIFQKGRLPYEKFISYAKQILEALAFCHKKIIAHRDIKPENILLDNYDKIKLADFGLSEKVDEFSEKVEFDKKADESFEKVRKFPEKVKRHSEKVKFNEKVEGSSEKVDNSYDAKKNDLLLLPPVMFNDNKMDQFKADIYALGITFFYMATGSYPYQRIQTNNLKAMIMSGQLFSPKFNIHPKIKNLIDRMIDKNSKESLSIEKLLELPIFSVRLTRRSMTVYQNPTFITQTSLNLNSSLNQNPTQPADILTYRSINNPKHIKINRLFQPQNTF